MTERDINLGDVKNTLAQQGETAAAGDLPLRYGRIAFAEHR